MSNKFTKQRGTQIQDDIEKQERQQRSRRIDEAIQRGYEHLMDDELAALGRLMSDLLIPDLNVSRHNLRRHTESVEDAANGLLWDHESVRRFVEDPGRYIQSVSSPAPSDPSEVADSLYLRAAGMTDPRSRNQKVITNAFHSLESLAVAKGMVSNSVTNWAPAKGYELQIGTWYQPPRDDMPYEIQLVAPGDSEEVTINMGKPGRGKGVMGHTEAEDRYAAGRKIVDLVDFDECEGAVYDIPMANPELREVREEMGLPPDFTELDGYDPEVEIMVPMTTNLGDKYIPYYGPNPEDTVVNFFTVPASRLSKKALKRFISGELTTTNKNIFETAYDQIQRSADDWNLHDLIVAVERQRGQHGNQGAVDRVIRAIRRIQSKGWIRDEDDPNAIDWERIMTNPDKITVFTASLMPDTDEQAKYLFHSYVIYAFRRELKRLKELPAREREHRDWNHVPKLNTILRELHEIAPNSETNSDDETIREIQDAMTSDFRNLTAMHRHEGVEVSADTQNFVGEIKKRARVNFNRACLFQVDFSPAKAMFEEMAGEPRDQYPRTVTKRYNVGECAVLGRVGTGRSFEMTVSVAPPMSHHFDPDEWVHPERGITKSREQLMADIGGSPEELDPDGWISVNSGWDLRVHLLDEEYRPASELLESSPGEVEQTDVDAIRNETKRPDHTPGQFAWDGLEIDPDARVPLLKVEWAMKAYAEQNGLSTEYDRQKIGQYLKGAPTPDGEKTYREVVDKRRPVLKEFPDASHQTPVYRGVGLKRDSEWMDCCNDPEFQIVWAEPEDADTPGAREADGWTCENCGGDGTDANPDADAEPRGEGGENTATAPEDAKDPATGDMDCCDSPDPHPMYAGEERDEQVGWKCSACGGKEWD